MTYPTSPATSQTYLYSNSALPSALTGVVDENGNPYATWTYDAMGRGLTSLMGSGAMLTTVAYDDKTGNRTVTNPLGQQEVFRFTTLQGLPKVTGNRPKRDRHHGRGEEAFDIRRQRLRGEPDDGLGTGNQTTYANNVHGLPTTINEAAGSPRLTHDDDHLRHYLGSSSRNDSNFSGVTGKIHSM